MSYTPFYSQWHDWPDVSTPITAAAMQHIESGIAAAGGTSSPTAEQQAGQLLNVTTAGDAGNRADHFLGSSLNAKWTTQTFPGTLSVGNSVAAWKSTSNTSSYLRQAFTPSGAFRVEARVGSLSSPIFSTSTGQGVSLDVLDSLGTTDVSVEFNQSFLMSKLISGTYTGVAELRGAYQVDSYQSGLSSANQHAYGLMWAYVALQYDGSGNWTSYGSWDRNLWERIGTVSLTFTPAQLGMQGFSNLGPFYADFIDVVS